MDLTKQMVIHKKMEFFDRLYLGFEAFKLPADFDFDILVTNQKEQFLKSNIKKRNIQPPYALQVKYRRIKETDFYDGPNGRPEARVNFPIKKQDVDLIIFTNYSSESIG